MAVEVEIFMLPSSCLPDAGWSQVNAGDTETFGSKAPTMSAGTAS
jgi:hypothetical protein